MQFPVGQLCEVPGQGTIKLLPTVLREGGFNQPIPVEKILCEDDLRWLCLCYDGILMFLCGDQFDVMWIWSLEMEFGGGFNIWQAIQTKTPPQVSA